MMNAIGSVINQIDSLVWGWWMIILLLGTHIFMTIRTGVIQRKIGTAIRLSVTKDTNAEGEVSQFGRAVRRQPTGSELGPPCPALRANPFPEVTDPFCRLPLPTLFHRPEAVHLGDLMRL